MILTVASVASFPPADLSNTPLAEFERLINFYAEENGLDPLVLAAVILLESNGDPNAYNEHSKATGLGQVMPQEAGPDFITRPTVRELKDPETNIKWTAMILAGYLDYHGSLYPALYAYSGGNDWYAKSPRDGLQMFEEKYWLRYLEQKERLADAGARYKVAHFSGVATVEGG